MKLFPLRCIVIYPPHGCPRNCSHGRCSIDPKRSVGTLRTVSERPRNAPERGRAVDNSGRWGRRPTGHLARYAIENLGFGPPNVGAKRVAACVSCVYKRPMSAPKHGEGEGRLQRLTRSCWRHGRPRNTGFGRAQALALLVPIRFLRSYVLFLALTRSQDLQALIF